MNARMKELETKILDRTATENEHKEYDQLKAERMSDSDLRMSDLLAKISKGEATDDECNEYDKLRIEKKLKKKGSN